jgi:hypothetical protein
MGGRDGTAGHFFSNDLATSREDRFSSSLSAICHRRNPCVGRRGNLWFSGAFLVAAYALPGAIKRPAKRCGGRGFGWYTPHRIAEIYPIELPNNHQLRHEELFRGLNPPAPDIELHVTAAASHPAQNCWTASATSQPIYKLGGDRRAASAIAVSPDGELRCPLQILHLIRVAA